MKAKLIGSILEQSYRDGFIFSKNKPLETPCIRTFLENNVEKITSVYVLHFSNSWPIYEEPNDGDFYLYQLLVNSKTVFKFELSIKEDSIGKIEHMTFPNYLKMSHKSKKVQIRLAVLLDLLEKEKMEDYHISGRK